MKSSTLLYLGIGFILIAITSIIFFVPRMGEEITMLQFTKYGIIVATEILLILNLLLVANNKNVFLVFSTTSITMLYFIINLVIVFAISTMQTLITWTSVFFLIYLALILILSFLGGHVAKEEALAAQRKDQKK